MIEDTAAYKKSGRTKALCCWWTICATKGIPATRIRDLEVRLRTLKANGKVREMRVPAGVPEREGLDTVKGDDLKVWLERHHGEGLAFGRR